MNSIVSAPAGENWFSITRRFEAPRRLIYKCYTEPQHMVHFWGPRNTTLEVCEIDLRVGGVWRVRWRFPNGDGWGYSSVYLEIEPDARIHYRDAPNDWAGGLDGLPAVDLLSTISLRDAGGGTEVVVLVQCTSVAARDENVKRGFANMVDTGHERLIEYLTTLDREA